MKSPCYNEVTKTDCPDRHVGCAINCPKWAAYTEERAKVYEERRRKVIAESGHFDRVNARVAKKEKHRMRRGKLY